MRVAIIGGAGAMAQTTLKDLLENSAVQKILVADWNGEKAKKRVESLRDPRVTAAFVDANEVGETANLIKNYDVVINSSQYYVNLSVMEACVQAGCHYNDLGGMFHVTRKQLELFDDFKKAGISAVLGIGSAPGITNLLARYAYDLLNRVEIVRLSDAAYDRTDMKGIDVFIPGYSIRTIMEEFSEESIQFIDGEYKKFPASSGTMEIEFPSPISKRTCIYTLHSEVATIPESFKDKGVKEVTWRLSLPQEIEERAKFLSSIGFPNKGLIQVKDVKVAPIDVLAAVVENQMVKKLGGVKLVFDGMECLRAQVIGEQNGKIIEYIVDCIAEPNKKWQNSSGEVCTGVPPSIVAQMQFKGIIKNGVWAPEKCIEPQYFFREISKRSMKIHVTKKQELIF